MKVSVWMSAYNHEKYISESIEGVLMQKTNFDFEIILGEDCSTDRTREIVIDYQKKYPDMIRLYLPEKNIGMMEIDVATFKMCKGEYIALLNGDDYWTDEKKLQTQVDYLENNPDTIMCFHKARVEDETNANSWETEFIGNGDTLPVECLLQGYNPIMTPSVMFRNIVDLPDWYSEMPYGDMPLYLILSEKGKIKYIDETMCFYRIHSNGQWQGDSLRSNLKKDLKFYEVMNEKLNFKYDGLIKKIITRRYLDLSLVSIRENNFEQAKFFYKRLTESKPEFSNKHEEDMKNIYKILYEGLDIKLFNDLIYREIQWRIN